MPLMVSKIDKRLVIPKKMRGIFPNEETLVIDLKAGEPKDVPKYVADYFTKNRPHVYRYANQPIKEEPKENASVVEAEKFDPLIFLESNYDRIEEALKQLPKRVQVLAVAAKLGIKNIHNQKTDRIIERIVQDVAVKNKLNAELQKHKDATGG